MSSIASRASWGARYRDGVGNRPLGSLETYFHHTVTTTLGVNATVAQERQQMRVIEGIGQSRFGAGISYNFIVFPSGRIYQGASVGRIAYHSGPGRNFRGAAICLAGNFEANKMTAQQKAAVAWLLRHGASAGWWSSRYNLIPHRTFSGTACPGNHAVAAKPEIERLARSGGGTTAPPKEIDMTPKQLFDTVWRGFKFQEIDKGTEYRRPAETPGSRLNAIASRAGKAVVISRDTRTRVAGLEKAVAAIGKSAGLSEAEVQKIIRESAEAALKDVSITLSVDEPEPEESK